VRAFRFELTRVQTPAIRKRVVSQLANVSAKLADAVATGLGMKTPPPMKKAASKIEHPKCRFRQRYRCSPDPERPACAPAVWQSWLSMASSPHR
jgi:hypothetical protein